MKDNFEDLICKDLKTKPAPEVGKILVTGANGYVGGHLVKELYGRGYQIRAALRRPLKRFTESWPGIETVIANARDLDQLIPALRGIHTAYYLIHSLRLSKKKFPLVDIEAAVNFRRAAEINKVKRIIYLGALGDSQFPSSPHLQTRHQVEKELQEGKVSCTILRAGIIIGSGSASYEILKDLTIKSPVILIPEWAKTKCQPISIQSLIRILVGILEKEETKGKVYDIGDHEVLSYEDMLKQFSFILNRKIRFIESSINSIEFYSIIASLMSAVPYQVIRSLMESCAYEVVCRNGSNDLNALYHPLDYCDAVKRALDQNTRS